jgi:hypothetical protein
MTYAAGIKHCNLSIPMEVGIYKVYILYNDLYNHEIGAILSHLAVKVQYSH